MRIESRNFEIQFSIFNFPFSIKMADFKNIIPFLRQAEGGLSRSKSDTASKYPCPTPYKGHADWHTNKGVTYQTWVGFFGKNQDTRFFAMSDADWEYMFKKGYWDKVKGDEIQSQALANIALSWVWGTGVYGGTKLLQTAMLQPIIYRTGYFGSITLKKINSLDEHEWFDRLCDERAAYFRRIGKGSQRANLTGWLDRLSKFRKAFRPI